MSAAEPLVRRASVKDVSRFIELGLRFYIEDGKRTACANELASFAISHLGDERRIFLAAGEPASAVLTGLISAHYLTGEPTAFKTSWYALPAARGYGAHLVRAFERWARSRGAQRIIVAGRHERTLTLLSRLGYSPLETVYEKDITWQNAP